MHLFWNPSETIEHPTWSRKDRCRSGLKLSSGKTLKGKAKGSSIIRKCWNRMRSMPRSGWSYIRMSSETTKKIRQVALKSRGVIGGLRWIGHLLVSAKRTRIQKNIKNSPSVWKIKKASTICTKSQRQKTKNTKQIWSTASSRVNRTKRKKIIQRSKQATGSETWTTAWCNFLRTDCQKSSPRCHWVSVYRNLWDKVCRSSW